MSKHDRTQSPFGLSPGVGGEDVEILDKRRKHPVLSHSTDLWVMLSYSAAQPQRSGSILIRC